MRTKIERNSILSPMKKVFHPEASRGRASYGWLEARYSFSFANYFNAERMNFGLLRVLNDDVVAPGTGFGTHPHENMEIITIPQRGALRHKDSMGNEGVIAAGDIQVMSAGSGVTHSEMNASSKEEVALFQIWIIPNETNVLPRYDQKKIASLTTPNTFTTVVKPKIEATKGDLWIHQNAYFNIANCDEDTLLEYPLKNASHGVYLIVMEGSVFFENQTLTQRDAMGLWDTPYVSMEAKKGSRLLLIEVPLN